MTKVTHLKTSKQLNLFTAKKSGKKIIMKRAESIGPFQLTLDGDPLAGLYLHVANGSIINDKKQLDVRVYSSYTTYFVENNTFIQEANLYVCTKDFSILFDGVGTRVYGKGKEQELVEKAIKHLGNTYGPSVVNKLTVENNDADKKRILLTTIGNTHAKSANNYLSLYQANVKHVVIDIAKMLDVSDVRDVIWRNSTLKNPSKLKVK